MDLKDLWAKEYQNKGIPSSFRATPTRVVCEFVNFLHLNGCKKGHAADLGCGRGRNSFYLADSGFKVTAIDFVEENVAGIKHENIHTYCQCVSKSWPLPKNSLEVAIDIFCYKHLTCKTKQARYRQELWKALKPKGYYFISLASREDGFYGPLLDPSVKSSKIIDPYAKVPSILYTLEELIREFSMQFTSIKAEEQTSKSPMHGKTFQRKVLNVIFQKK